MSAQKYLRKEDNKVVEAKQITKIIGNEVYFNDGSQESFEQDEELFSDLQLGWWMIFSDDKEGAILTPPFDFNQEYENYFAKDE